MTGRTTTINPDNFVRAIHHSKGSVLDLGAGKIELADTTVDVEGEPDVKCDLDEFPYPFDENEYDTVWAIHVLEHLEEPEKAIEEMKRIAKERIVVIIPIGERPSDNSHKRVYMPEDLDRFDFDIIEQSRMGGFVDAVMVWKF